MCALSDIMQRSLQGKVVGGRYQLLSLIGQGGFGEVWKAIDARNGSTVAVKMPHHQFAINPKVASSLRGECEVLKALSHPNICQLLDFENDPVYGPILITEHIEGGDVWKASRKLDLPQFIDVLIGVLHGLSYLHGQNIIHLDLKPPNILVGPFGPKLIDFGLASFKSPEHFAGTLSYVAPETLLHEERSLSADIYSLGVVIYECLTGINPFRDGDPEETKKLQKEWNPPPPSKHRDTIPDWLSVLVMQMLKKNPKERCAISDALRTIRVAHDSPIEPDKSHSLSFATASGKFVGRKDIMQEIHASFQKTSTPRIMSKVIEGERGAGKTRLLNEIKFDAKICGVQTILLESAESASPAALTPLAEALSSPQSPVLLLIDDFDKWGDQVPALGAILETLRTLPHPLTWIGCVLTTSGATAVQPDLVLQPFSMDELSDYLLAVAPIPDGPLRSLSQQLHTQTGGNPRRLTQLMKRMVERNYFASDGGQWDASLFEDVTVEISQVFSEQITVLQPDALLEIAKQERLGGHSATALERIVKHADVLNAKLVIEAAECALASGRANAVLQLMDQTKCDLDGEVLFWKGILLTSLRQMDAVRSTLNAALELALANNDQVLEIRVENQLARCALLEGDQDGAIDAYRASAMRARALPEQCAQKIINNELGYALLMRGMHSEALPILQEYGMRCEVAHHTRRHLNAIVQIGDCHAKMNNVQSATEAYIQAIYKARDAQQIDILSHAYNQLGKLQFEHSVLSEAVMTLKRAISINHMIGDLSAAAVNTTNLGLSQLRANLIDDARVNLETARAFLVRCPDMVQRTLVPCLLGLADIASQERRSNKSMLLLNEAETLAIHHAIYSEYKDPIDSIRKTITGQRADSC